MVVGQGHDCEQKIAILQVWPGQAHGPAAVTQNHEPHSSRSSTGVIASFKCSSVFLLYQTRSTGANHRGLQ